MLIKSISRKTIEPILNSHGWPYLAPFETSDIGFRYPLLLGTRTAVIIQVTGLKSSTRVKAHPPLPLRQMELVKHTVEHMLSLDFPLHEFEATCREKKAWPLLRLAKKGWGRMLRSPTLWEDAVKTLCTTNASWGYTEQMCRNLCLQLGEATHSGMMTFPLPEKVLKAGQRFLKEKVGMGYRDKSLLLLANKAASGQFHGCWILR